MEQTGVHWCNSQEIKTTGVVSATPINESDMAKIIENEKGFKVIEIDYLEMLKIGCGNICDHCGEPHYGMGYYVAVMNRWLCPTCYENWYLFATNYATEHNADGRIETKNFERFKTLLGL